MILPAPERIHARPLDRGQGQNHIVLTHATVVNHSTEGGFIPALLCLLAILVHRPDHDVLGPVMTVAPCFIREAQHFPCLGVEFWVRGKRWREDLPLEIVAADRFESDGVHDIRWAILLAGQKHASPERDVRV